MDIDRLMQLMLSEAQSQVLESVASACEHVTWTITVRLSSLPPPLRPLTPSLLVATASPATDPVSPRCTSHAVGSLAGGVQVVGGRSGCGAVNSGKGPGMVLGSKPGPGPTRRPVSLRPTAPCKL